jgi:hypothetical protein
MPLVIKFRDVGQAIRIVRALCPEVDDIEADQIRREYDERGWFDFGVIWTDKTVLVTVAKVGDIARTTMSGYKEYLDVTEAFCRRIGAEYSVE